MKKTLYILFFSFLLFGMESFGQKTTKAKAPKAIKSFPQDTVATLKWVREYVEKELSRNKTVVENTIGATPDDFYFITNTTGYFDSDDFDTKIKALAPSSRVVRFCVRWDEYEKSPNVYSNDRLAYRVERAEAIYASLNLPAPLFTINVWGIRHKQNDIGQYIPENDVIVLSNGIMMNGLNNTSGAGSLSSSAYRAKMASLAANIAKWFVENRPTKLYYMSFSMGATEEFFNHLLVGSQGWYIANGDYSASALTAFRAFLVAQYGQTTPWGEASTSATLPVVDWNAGANEPWRVSNMLVGGQNGVPVAKAKAWATFVNKEMYSLMMTFKNAVKGVNPSTNVIHFIADYYRDQACGWLLYAPSVFEIVSELDGLYHSDGDMAYDGDNGKKYSSFDSSVPTWGSNKLYFNEMDYVDMHMGNQHTEGHIMPNESVVLDVARATFRKGGSGIHYAMSGNQAQWEAVNRINLTVLAEIQAGTLTRLNRSNAPSAKVNLYPNVLGGNRDFIRDQWRDLGGNATNVVNIRLIDNK